MAFMQETACGTTALRLLNLLLGAAALALFYAAHQQLHPDCSSSRSLGTVRVCWICKPNF